MPAEWTAQQREAIEDRGHSLIVCAAAGSGKTAVLTERIVRLVREGTPLSSMLVVTFTRAAAGEMRGRIAAALRQAALTAEGPERAFLTDQSFCVGQAQISTLHSFCGNLLREHFELLNLDPAFRVGDEQECAVLRAAAMEDALYGCYETGSEAFLSADRCFTEDRLSDMAGRLLAFADAQPDPDAWMERAAAALEGDDGTLLSGEAVRLLLHEAAENLGKLEEEAGITLELCGSGVPAGYAAACSSDLELVEGLAAAARAGSYRALHDAAAALALKKEGVSLARIAGRAAADSDRERMEEIKGRRGDLSSALYDVVEPFLPAPEEAAADLRATARPLAGLIELAKTYGALYRAAKRRRGILDFDDLEREALRALTGEDAAVREALAQRYRYVFVDEYQDSSAVQEAILSAFANLGRTDALFQVGDIKQSIYRFRRALPSLFREKAALYADGRTQWARRIDLNCNFRSCGNILSGVNAVFEKLMTGGDSEIEYDERERLVCGLPEREDDPPLEVHVLGKPRQQESDGQDEEKRTALAEEREALLAAERILKLHGQPAYDAKAGAERPLAWRDFAVLMRTVQGTAARVSEVLSARGIPVYCDVGQEYFEIPEVRQMIAVLQAVDNRRRDTALIAALRGPALGFSDDDLARIRIAGGSRVSFAEAFDAACRGEDELAARLREAEEKLETWRLCARHQGVDRLIERILTESQMEIRAAALPDGAARLSNLHLLQTRARSFTKAQGASLHAFLSYVERLKAGGDSASASAIGESEDVVRVMSVHKSKGLEFPVVLLLGAGKSLSGKDTRSELLMDDALGAAIPCMDTELSTERRTLLQRAIAGRRDREARAEELRVLYVAMTRARNRLILVGRLPRGKVPEKWAAAAGALPLTQTDSQLDMVCPLLAAAGADFEQPRQAVQTADARWEVFFHDEEGSLAAKDRGDAVLRLKAMVSGEADEQTLRLIAFKPETGQTLRKTSVSAVVRDEKYRAEGADEAPAAAEELKKRPRFMTERKLSGAEIGTAFHRLACACDLEALRVSPDRRAEAERQWEEMAARGVLSAAEAKAVTPAMLSALYASPLGARILAAGQVEREWAFTWRRRTAQAEQLLQGVIDCCFIEDGAWVLVDYKTDSPREIPAALERHRPQLALYAEALEALTGVPVKERILWMVRAGKGFTV